MDKLHLQQIFAPISACTVQCPHGIIIKDKIPICQYNNKEVEFFNSEYNCPSGFWRSELNNQRTYIRVLGPSEEKTLWEKIKDKWSQASSLATAVTSGQADEEIIKIRQNSCNTCPDLYKAQDGHQYCGVCGCGEWPIARIDGLKLKFKELPCPRKRAGFSNA